MHSHGHKTTVFVKMNSYIILEWGALINKTTLKGGAYSLGGGAYWKEDAKSNSYGNHGFGGRLDG